MNGMSVYEKRGQVLEMNPYVTKILNLSESLGELQGIFAIDKKEKNYADEDVREIAESIVERKDIEALGLKDKEELMCLVEKILEDIEEYGAELSIKNKRQMEKDYFNFQEINEIVQQEYGKIKMKILKKGRVQEERDASLLAMLEYAAAVTEAADELDKSIYYDARAQKVLAKNLKKYGIKTLKITVIVQDSGTFEIILTGKCKQGEYATGKEIGEIISSTLGRLMYPENAERIVMLDQYCTMRFVEKTSYQMNHGVAQIEKNGSTCSGDNFLFKDLAGGKKVIVVSDGMGTGNDAYQMSKKIVESVEVLLEGGMSPEKVAKISNSILVSRQENINFGTLDICMANLHTGKVSLIKAGGANTFIVHQSGNKQWESRSLPLGIVNEIELDQYEDIVEEESFIVMMTDGASELIEGDKGEYISNKIKENPSNNPKVLANYLLDDILDGYKGEAKDDMMVVVALIWRQRNC